MPVGLKAPASLPPVPGVRVATAALGGRGDAARRPDPVRDRARRILRGDVHAQRVLRRTGHGGPRAPRPGDAALSPRQRRKCQRRDRDPGHRGREAVLRNRRRGHRGAGREGAAVLHRGHRRAALDRAVRACRSDPRPEHCTRTAGSTPRPPSRPPISFPRARPARVDARRPRPRRSPGSPRARG